MSVSAIIVSRGDVDLSEIIASIPQGWETLLWRNGGELWVHGPARAERNSVPDLGVYGRYAAIQYASNDLIYVQDDDVIVSDPQKIVDSWIDSRDRCAEEQFDPRFLWHASPEEIEATGRGDGIACNMPPEFRHDFYRDHALVGFGAVFHRDAPQKAFSRFGGFFGTATPAMFEGQPDLFYRACDIVFTGLTPRILVDVPKRNLPWASDDNRMWRQPTHVQERQRMLDLVRKVAR